ncbi:MAG: DegT/DnrJ/EryC1/StrS family aminotransferase [Bacteroidales bacterium]|nr:DegT/DnrJ/EryC1/StrS family aminotransferase [Bacteroidales bacterium]
MLQIQMVDLKTQYERIRPEIDDAIFSVISSSAFIKGPDVKQFEEELKSYLGVNHVISCGNGTDALQIVMMSLGLKPGDEVITTNFTFIATLETVALLGLKPVIVEPESDSFNISVSEIARAITPRTRAIVPVHLFGQCADMDGIMDLARKNNLFVIEDAAQATGADYFFADGKSKKAGTIGTAGTTSFFPSKNLGCYGDGGAVYTNDDGLAAKIRSIANHGMKIRYHYDDIGLNSRLDTLQAAILRVKLRHLDDYNKARQTAAGFYDKALAGCDGIVLPGRKKYSSHIFHQYTIKVRNGKRDELKKYLEENNIPSMIYYPGPLHMQQAYRYLGYRDSDFPVTDALCREVLSLPMHTELDQKQLEYITEKILGFFQKQ